MNTILMYIIQDEKELPAQMQNNTAYYIVGRQVLIKDNLGQTITFDMHQDNDTTELVQRVENCESQIQKVIKYLTSFS